MLKLATAEIWESEEYNDVTMRIATELGSTPIQIVNEGQIQSAHQIGMQVLEAFNYFVKSRLIPQPE